MVIEVDEPQRIAAALRQTGEDQRAFLPVYEEHVDGLLSFLARRTLDVEVALDLLAETFAQAYIGAESFKGTTDAEAAAWLYRIGRRQLARYYRRSKVERRALDRLGLEPPVLDDVALQTVVDQAEITPLKEALGRELGRLPAEQRRALQMRVVEELPYRTVASELGISEEAARSRVARGLKAMRERLEAFAPRTEVA